MDEKRKRYVERMEELDLRASDIERRGGLKPGSVRDYLGRPDRPGNEPSIEKAVRLAKAVNWTLEQFYHNVNKIELKLRIDGVTKGQGMWSSVDRDRPEEIPLEIPTKGLVAIKVSREGEAPHLGFRAGDTIVGNKFEGPNFGNLVRTECVICTDDGQRLLGVLHPGTKKGRYNVQPLNPMVEAIHDVALAWVAPITLIVRNSH
jgi:hypothetical protein